jgi:hypothetical protein
VLAKFKTVLAGVTLLGLALGGCTSELPGNPSGQTTSPSTSVTTSSSSATARPAALKVDGLDPCKGFTADQMQQLKLGKANRSDNDLVKKGNVPVCQYTASSLKFTYGVGFIPNEGIAYWRSGGGNVEKKNVQVAGYDSIRLNLIGASTQCSIWVDVADGQMLYVDYIPLDTQTLDEVCGKAQQGAELALATLKTLR